MKARANPERASALVAAPAAVLHADRITQSASSLRTALLLERAQNELARRTALKDKRSARSAVVGQIDRSITDWLTSGLPGNCVPEAVEDPPLSELLIQADAGRIDAAVARFRGLVETHTAALTKLRASPFTADEARAVIAAQINAAAGAATPNVSCVMMFLEPVRFGQVVSHVLARNVNPEVPPAIVGSEAVDTFGTLCWMFRSEMIAKLQGMVTESDGAVSQQDREVEEARLGTLLLETERRECAAIWAADASGTVIDFRPGTSPQASASGLLLAITGVRARQLRGARWRAAKVIRAGAVPCQSCPTPCTGQRGSLRRPRCRYPSQPSTHLTRASDNV